MKKKVFGRKLSRDTGSRRALFRALVRAFVLTGAIVTTKAKAKAVSYDIEKIVTKVKRGTLSDVRSVNAALANDREVLSKLTTDVKAAFEGLRGGYTRIISLPVRRGDAAQMAKLTWTREVLNSKNEKVDLKKEKSEDSKKEKPTKDKSKENKKEKANS